jgi:membrane-bound metal-dependent hydrolase YbcI (DUF457 family)
MLFLTIWSALMLFVGMLGFKDRDPRTSTRGMFGAGVLLLILDVWCYLVYHGIYFN